MGGLYAANTFGAVAGIALITLATVPAWGLGASAGLLAAVNLGCAVTAWALARAPRSGAPAAAAGRPVPMAVRRPSLLLFPTGVLGVGYEVLVVRVASQVLENTVYSFAAVLAVYLLGAAIGAALYQARPPRIDAASVLPRLLTLTALLCLLGIAVLWSPEPLFRAARDAAGGGVQGAWLGELAVAAAVLLLPTAAMGASFAHLAQAAAAGGFGLGRALALNTVGGALAPALFGVLLLPAAGSLLSLIACASGYWALSLVEAPGRGVRLLLPPGLAAALAAGLSPLALLSLAPGERVLAHVDGVMAAVSVVQDAAGERHMRVNGRFQMGGSSSAYSDRREAHIALLLHPHPRRALFLGLGAGITFAAAARHPGLSADGVELVPEMVPLMRHFVGYGETPTALRVHAADARRYVHATEELYDVIVADLFHPARDGAGSLYTVEHFRAVRERLAPGGLFVQWLPLYQMDLDTLRTVVRTFLAVYPEAAGLLAHYSLVAPIVGLAGGPGLAVPTPDPARLRAPGLAQELRGLRLDSEIEVLGAFLAGARELAAFAGAAPLNTDDRPVVTYRAPRFVYAPASSHGERLLALLDAFAPDPGLALGEERAGTLDPAVRRRLQDYLLARDTFVRAGAGVAPQTDVRTLVRKVRDPLLQAVRASRDFAAAYNPLLAMAYRLHAVDPAAARDLLRDLQSANPWRDEAAELRRRLFGPH